jgi:hypothetical protein
MDMGNAHLFTFTEDVKKMLTLEFQAGGKPDMAGIGQKPRAVMTGASRTLPL